MTTTRRSTLALLIVPLLAFLPACESAPALRKSTAWQGQTPVLASYMWGTLETELPPGFRLESALVSARQQLIRQGHILDKWAVTPQGGSLVALAPPDAPYQRVHVSGRTHSSGGVELRINIDPDSEARTRQILDAVLLDLGV